MRNIDVHEARARFSELLRRVAEGEAFTITKDGMPVATLSPVEQVNRASIKRTIEDILRFRREHALEDIYFKEMIEEGRKY